MRLIIHQALKDVRLLGGIITAWVLVLVAYHALIVAASFGYSPAPRAANGADMLLLAGGIGMCVVVAVLLVQTDSPVRPTAFWLTRPISGSMMLAAKLLVAVALLVLLPILLDDLDLAIAGFPPLGWNAAAPLSAFLLGVLVQFAWILPLLAVAALTETLSQFVVVVIVEYLVFFALAAFSEALLPRVWMPRNTSQAAVIFLPAIVAYAGLLLPFAYVTRRRTIARVLLGVAPLVMLVLIINFSPLDRRGTPAISGLDLTGVSVTTDATTLRESPAAAEGWVTLALPVTITGLPANVIVDASGNARLSPGFERVVVGKQGTACAAVGGEQKAPEPSGSCSTSVHFAVSTSEYERAKGQKATLELELTLRVSRVEATATATAPVEEGAAYRVGLLHGVITGWDRSGDSVAIRVRETVADAVVRYAPLRVFLRRPGMADSVPTASRDVGPVVGTNLSILPRHVEVRRMGYLFPSAERAPGWSDWPRGWQLVVAQERRTTSVARKIVVPDLVIGGAN